MYKSKLFLISFVIILLAIVISSFWHPWQKDMSNLESVDKKWVKYENVRLGFSIEYPEDVITVQEENLNEPGIISFVTTDNSVVVAVNVASTTSTNIQSYFSQFPDYRNNPQNYTLTTLAGKEAIKVAGVAACSECSNTSFIAQARLYTFSMGGYHINEAKRMRNSFALITTP